MTDTKQVMRASSNIEVDRSRLTNVFRVISSPQHELRDKAIRLRQEISSKWEHLAAKGEWFPWPTTIALPAAQRIKVFNWRQQGMLSFLGYHVGATQPTPLSLRQCILEYVFECHLPPLEDRSYYLEWSMPRTAGRLKKLADTLAALTRNAKRRDEVTYAKAVEDWECDLVFLRERYYVDFFHFAWPATNTLH
jgi:hypothetical protein